MTTNVETIGREAVLVQDAAQIQMMGLPVLEALPARGVPYQRVDPFLLVHESRFRLSELSGIDTKHPHRGFDNLWYILEGSASTGHSTGPGGAIERARLPKGALLALRTGRGAWHAEGIGAEEREEGLGDTQWRSVLFWVNLARKDKQAAPSSLVLQPDQIPVRQQGDATVRTLVGDGSPVPLGTPALILDVGAAHRRTGDHPGAGRVPGLRLCTGRRGRLWGQPPPGPAGPAGPAGSRDRAGGHRRHPRHPVPAHDRPALRGSPHLQRPVRGLARQLVPIGGPRMAGIEPEHTSKGLRLGNRKLSHLPPRLITGAYIVNTGVSKLGAGEETAKGLHGMATAAYPFLGKLDAQTFTRLLGAGELTLGASLLLPIVPTALAGLGLAGFSAGLLGLYLRIPGMRQNGSLRPTAQGTPLAKDAWLLGIGLSFVIDTILSRGDDTG